VSASGAGEELGPVAQRPSARFDDRRASIFFFGWRESGGGAEVFGLRRAATQQEPPSVWRFSCDRRTAVRGSSPSSTRSAGGDSADSNFCRRGRGGRGGEQSAKLCQQDVKRVGGTSSSIWCRWRQFVVRNRRSRLRLFWCDDRDAHEGEPPLQRRGQVGDTPVAAVGGAIDGETGLRRKRVSSSSPDGQVFLGQVEISGPARQCVGGSVPRTGDGRPRSHSVMIGDGSSRAGLAFRDDHRAFPST